MKKIREYYHDLKNYVESKPRRLYPYFGIAETVTIYDAISRGVGLEHILPSLVMATSAVATEIYLKSKKNMVRDEIENNGFSPKILSDTLTKKLAEKYAKKTDRLDEYKKALTFNNLERAINMLEECIKGIDRRDKHKLEKYKDEYKKALNKFLELDDDKHTVNQFLEL